MPSEIRVTGARIQRSLAIAELPKALRDSSPYASVAGSSRSQLWDFKLSSNGILAMHFLRLLLIYR